MSLISIWTKLSRKPKTVNLPRECMITLSFKLLKGTGEIVILYAIGPKKKDPKVSARFVEDGELCDEIKRSVTLSPLEKTPVKHTVQIGRSDENKDIESFKITAYIRKIDQLGNVIEEKKRSRLCHYEWMGEPAAPSDPASTGESEPSTGENE